MPCIKISSELSNLKVEIFGNSGLKIHALNFKVALMGEILVDYQASLINYSHNEKIK